MQIMLAPMEGVVDHLMRDMLTRIGGYDLCVTEFLRVVESLQPEHVFYKICPELRHRSLTPSGVPVRVQLLGQHPQWMAANAQRAVELGSPGVDINFGCPAKTVNKSRGGAALLNEPNTLFAIVDAVRRAVPAGKPVTAKIRLGFEHKSQVFDNVSALTDAGATAITIHARTKTDGYKPPAYWDWIAQVKQMRSVPVIANGEIWTAEDAARCREVSQCDDIMLGRGALSMPNLALTIRDGEQPMPWDEVTNWLVRYSGYEIFGDKGRYYPNRIKQWFGYLKNQYPEALAVFNQIRTLRHAEEIVEIIDANRCISVSSESA
ncbi:tRNA-dihydrouridine synthase [Alteromonas oceanisediminis]|uniref:tRNA-dihydrouridine synthase n=1 Tax=Alteromonas oceanisediminis TaxID=2836180 RepID=UPI001BDA485F|nr:tRNA-dihydrouridine synthase [Alteromonas oceanisediminis]MBT0588034.1 tRNA-dihydrouridine synthase [Alteromonas oceanisediminis]